jgi:aerobic carbon-monoxide dehydrogenase large subunit
VGFNIAPLHTDNDPGRDDYPWIGAARPRVEDDRLTTGAGNFSSDRSPADCLHIVFVRSPFPAARILDIEYDITDASDVIAVYTGDDTADLATLPVNPIVENIQVPVSGLLARGEVSSVGQPVALVVARTTRAAQDAAEGIFVDYEETDTSDDIFADCPDNLAFEKSWTDGDVSDAFSDAYLTVKVRNAHPRLTAMPLEPRAMVAEWQEDVLCVRLATQTPHRARTDIATSLGLDEAQVRVIATDVGGAFGARASLHPEEVLVAWAANKLRKSVKWIAERSEDFLSQCHGRGTICEGQAAFTSDGRMTALKANIDGLLGHWLPYSAAVPSWNAARILPGPYDVDDLDIKMSAYLSRTSAVNIYRGAGRPEAALLMERLMDSAARQLGIDPVAIRQRNFLRADQLPKSRITGAVPDSGDYAAALNKLVEISDYKELRRQQETRTAAGEHVGLGIGFYIEPCGQGWESARVSLDASGNVTAATGSSAQGQGRETAYQQIVADVLDVNPDDVLVVHGDTAHTPPGIGALASRSTAIGGSALLQAAREVAQQKKDNPGRQDYVADVIYEAKAEAWSYGCCLALVAVDADTGVVDVENIWWLDDAGTVVNPMLVKGQIMGGIAQGLGEVLMEKIVYDENGQLLTGSLMDYALPRADDMPDIEIHQQSTPTDANLLGAKGVGEAGTIGAPAAVLNAVLDALAPLGVDHLDMPATGETVWQAIRSAREGNGK